MDWLIIIIMIASAIVSSVNKSNEAKNKHTARQQNQPNTSKPNMVKPNKEKKGNTYSLEDIVGQLQQALSVETPDKQPVAQPAAAKKPKSGKKKSPAQKQQAKPVGQALTLFEQADAKNKQQRKEPQREQSDLQPVKASVQPLKNVYENTEQCEHRINLNPNIHYGGHDKIAAAAVKQVAIHSNQADEIVQGIIWSEILGKPKALRQMQRRP